MFFKEKKFVLSYIFLMLFLPLSYSKTIKKTGVPSSRSSSSSPENKKKLVTYNWVVTSNYIWRGISQTANSPAVQGGIVYSPSFLKIPGIYGSLWGSNVKFNDDFRHRARLEVDPSIGISNEIKEKFTYDLSVIHYHYFNTIKTSYYEFIGIFRREFLTGFIGYTNNIYATRKTGVYTSGEINFDLPARYILGFNNMHLTAGIGHYYLPPDVGLTSYSDYRVQLSKNIREWIISLQWTDTNEHDFIAYSGSKLVFSVAFNTG